MRPAGLEQMQRVLSWLPQEATILDVGACDVNGTFRPLIDRDGWQYVGVDIVPGANVDVVSKEPYHYPWREKSFDAVISGYTMEHVPAIWVWVEELVRLLKPGGLLAVITHTSYRYHPHPVDCWRIMPDGFRYLFDRTGQLERYEICEFGEGDILGAAWKR